MTQPTRRTALAAGAGLVAAPFVAPPFASSARAAGRPVVPLPDGGCPTDPRTPKRDLRAMWVASVENIDWPSRTGLSAEQQRTELVGWLDLAQQQRHNAIVLQVRPTADAFWPSDVEPWSAYLSGTQGVEPGWDPLGFAVDAAHERGLELHAWFNPFRVSQRADRSVLVPEHPGAQHPDWVVAYGGKLYYNPGLPQVRELCRRAIIDAVRRYDIDAVHFDDYFYPYPVAGQVFDDAAAYAEHGQGFSLEDWRRDNINRFMSDLRDDIRRTRPTTQLGVSPFAIWRNRATDPEGSDTTAGAETYDDLYADTRKWVREEAVDYIAPQVYWSRGFAAADYEKVTDWWAEQVTGTRVHLFIGQATYKVAANADPSWDDPQELSSHLEFNTRYPQIDGNMFFSAKQVRLNALDATGILNRTWYSRPSLTPASPWLDDRPGAPRAITRVVLGRGGQQPTLRWSGTDGDARLFVVYRVPRDRATSCDLADARHIADIVPARRGVQTWTDPQPVAGPVTYVVTPVDRVRQEGPGTVAR